MTLRSRFGLAAVVLVAASLVSVNASAFDLMKRNAKPANLESLVGDGRWTVIMLWQLDCAACEAQKPHIDDFHVKHVDSKARVIGIATDGMDQIGLINKAIRKNPTRFPHYVVERDTFASQLKASTGSELKGSPSYIFYDPDGKFVGMHHAVVDPDALEAVVTGKPAGRTAALTTKP